MIDLTKKENKPEYQSLGELIATMKEVVHREYFSGIKERVLMDSIEQWMLVAYNQGWKEKAEQMLREMKSLI